MVETAGASQPVGTRDALCRWLRRALLLAGLIVGLWLVGLLSHANHAAAAPTPNPPNPLGPPKPPAAARLAGTVTGVLHTVDRVGTVATTRVNAQVNVVTQQVAVPDARTVTTTVTQTVDRTVRIVDGTVGQTVDTVRQTVDTVGKTVDGTVRQTVDTVGQTVGSVGKTVDAVIAPTEPVVSRPAPPASGSIPTNSPVAPRTTSTPRVTTPATAAHPAHRATSQPPASIARPQSRSDTRLVLPYDDASSSTPGSSRAVTASVPAAVTAHPAPEPTAPPWSPAPCPVPDAPTTLSAPAYDLPAARLPSGVETLTQSSRATGDDPFAVTPGVATDPPHSPD